MEANSIKILIVEDEAIIAERLFADLQDYGYEVLEPCLTVEEALQTLATEKPDLALLDINLKSTTTGIHLGGIIHEQYKFPFIFLTANTDDATINQAASVKPQAFLSKPVQLKTLIGTIQVAIFNHQSNKLQTVIDATASFHFIKSGNTYVKVDWANVTHIESDKKYAQVYVKDNKAPYVLRISLDLLVQQLSVFQFIRIYKSYLINLSFVTAFSYQDVTLNGHIVLPVGESYRAAFMQRLKMYQ
jgi:two-component system, LytTR family, response regulator LytT